MPYTNACVTLQLFLTRANFDIAFCRRLATGTAGLDRLINRTLPIRWLPYCCSISDQDSDITTDKLKAFSASYINSVLLLGTVVGIKMFPMQNNPDRNWVLVFLRTRLSTFREAEYAQPTSITDINEPTVMFKKTLSSSNRVHVFSPKLVNGLRDIKPGERLLVSGFLSYYQSSKLDGKTTKQCCVTAQRIAHMGWAPDYQVAKNSEEVFEQSSILQEPTDLF
ncbi:unnamed protein product [Heterobilharzia americana]|nr:unnamed protein product [Heterobilharzia americana]